LRVFSEGSGGAHRERIDRTAGEGVISVVERPVLDSARIDVDGTGNGVGLSGEAKRGEHDSGKFLHGELHLGGECQL
jgi:hypothetical protein